MKTRFPSILGVFAAILMVASFVVPDEYCSAVSGICRPGHYEVGHRLHAGIAVVGKNDIYNCRMPSAARRPARAAKSSTWPSATMA